MCCHGRSECAVDGCGGKRVGHFKHCRNHLGPCAVDGCGGKRVGELKHCRDHLERCVVDGCGGERVGTFKHCRDHLEPCKYDPLFRKVSEVLTKMAGIRDFDEEGCCLGQASVDEEGCCLGQASVDPRAAAGSWQSTAVPTPVSAFSYMPGSFPAH
jgi:hypothetical protein